VYDRYLPADWRDAVDDESTWEAVDQIPDGELFAARQDAKLRMVRSIRQRIREERRRRGELPSRIDAVDALLDPNALTIGFARRFATYKRATLLFRDPERLKRILGSSACPVQIVFAGKAHPADEPGKALIQRIYQLMHEPEFEGRVLFVEDYDIDLARHLVQGCDVWLNTPLRPLEASGTSGQKAALNGVPNASVLDGWWHEGYDGTNGWSIGDDRDYESSEARDIADSRALYDLIENTMIPLYASRTSNGLPAAWLRVVRAAIRSVAPRFNTHRMVKEYVRRYYLPACTRGTSLSADDYAGARRFVSWKQDVARHWPSIRLNARIDRTPITSVGKPIHVEADVHLDRIEPQHVVVEVVHAKVRNGSYELLGSTPLDYAGAGADGSHRFAGAFVPSASGNITYGVRVLPSHPALPNSVELGLVRWADPAEGHAE
jgi:starch phosphorylase